MRGVWGRTKGESLKKKKRLAKHTRGKKGLGGKSILGHVKNPGKTTTFKKEA